jgi:hypothetical protein
MSPTAIATGVHSAPVTAIGSRRVDRRWVVQLEDDEHRMDRDDFADSAPRLDHGSRLGSRDRDRRLVGHHLDQRFVFPNRVARLHKPADDLALGHALADIRQPELPTTRHGSLSPVISKDISGRR